ncbi:uncharacterized protein LOC129759752 [Uranotaenia lowii]|uniref:uncharacterized protein LOC129759752 n=1 Tax=Uranotaenia lowii TaxID=190385 RepID=UPI00247AAB21|nr:uncharacterized protein LOC129759752 [Uranotaenia lowii]
MRRIGLADWLCKWINSYLVDRTANVRLNNVNLTLFRITSGVPQGSHLAPLIFVLFINDLCANIESEKLLYADDLKNCRIIASLVDCCALQKDIDSILTWCHQNGMAPNISKCSVRSFTRKRQPLNFEYKMSSTTLSRNSIVKDLCIILDTKLTFTQPISTITAKGFAVIGFIRRNTQFFNDYYSLKAFYCALERSIVEYGVQIWAPYQVVQANRIERVQRCFFRYALRQIPWNDALNLPPYELLVGSESTDAGIKVHSPTTSSIFYRIMWTVQNCCRYFHLTLL